MKNYKIKDLVTLISELGHIHPNINYVGVGQLNEVVDDINSYPYLWIGVEENHTLVKGESGFNEILYTFTLRVADIIVDVRSIEKNKVNNPVIRGLGLDNSLDAHSDCFNILLEVITSLDSNLTEDLKGIEVSDDVIFTPFFDEELGGNTGFDALVTIKVPLRRKCNTPLIDAR